MLRQQAAEGREYGAHHQRQPDTSPRAGFRQRLLFPPVVWIVIIIFLSIFCCH